MTRVFVGSQLVSMQGGRLRMKLTPWQAKGKTKETSPRDFGKPWSGLT